MTTPSVSPPPDSADQPQCGDDPAWHAVMQRCADLASLLTTVRLKTSATKAADLLGLDDPMALHRELLRRRLPPFALLRDWCYVVELVTRFGADNSLGHWAMHRGEYPAVYYQFVRRVTGLSWRELLCKGPAWAKQRALSVWAPYLEDTEV